MKNRRIDPADGAAYTFAELSAYYKDQFSEAEIHRYWAEKCTTTKAAAEKDSAANEKQQDIRKKAAAEKDTAVETPKEQESLPPSSAQPRPKLRRTRSWLVKVEGITLLPCEEALQEDIKSHSAYAAEKDIPGMQACQLRLLQDHPFVGQQSKAAHTEALGAGVTCEVANFKMNVNKFKKWLSTPAGKPFAEKGKGYDDGCYLTSAVLRSFMPRGYTHFSFSNASQEKASVVLRGFFKFTGLTAADEDEVSNVTSEVGSFMFHGYSIDDASRFVVTTKSNGENGKYSVRKVFGEWYCFAGSKNTGVTWKLGKDVSDLYPIPHGDSIAAVGPKIIAHVHSIMTAVPERAEFLETVDRERLTIMVEWNDDTHEHIFPIDVSWADHVAILDARGFPLPQADAYKFFDKFGLRRVQCDSYDGTDQLSTVMDTIRKSKDTEGAVIYLERSDDVPVGLIKVKSDHYAVARRTREILRTLLIRASNGRKSLKDELSKTQKQLRKGMKDLTHVGDCALHHKQWSDHACAFAESWAAAFETGDARLKRALVVEFNSKYGSLYQRFYDTKGVLPLSEYSMDSA